MNSIRRNKRISKFQYNLSTFVAAVLTICSAYLYIDIFKFRLDSETVSTTGYLVEYTRNSRRESPDDWSGIYEFHVDGKTYRSLSSSSRYFKSNIKKERKIYYNVFDPSINKTDDYARLYLASSLIFGFVTIFAIIIKRSPNSGIEFYK